MFRFLALVGALCAAMSFPSFAADAPACKFTYDAVIADLKAKPEDTVYEIPADKMPQVLIDAKEYTDMDLTGVTRGFLVQEGGMMILGLEKDGCLLPAIYLVKKSKAVESGATANGIGA